MNDILASALDFYSDGIGALLLQIAEAFYSLLYPANADAATPVIIPE